MDDVRHLLDAGHYSEAVERGRALLSSTEAETGPDSIETARVLDLLVEALWRNEENLETEALELARRSVTLKETLAGPEDPEVAASLRNLGWVLFDFDLAGAKAVQERALAIREKSLGTRHPLVAQSLDDLARCFLQSGDPSGALERIALALAIQENSGRFDDGLLARILTTLGIARLGLGDSAGAKSALEKALAIRERLFGPDHPDVTASLTNLGNVFFTTGDYAEARKILHRVVSTLERTVGTEHVDLGSALFNYSIVLQQLGDYVAALQACERALEINQKTLGAGHPFTGRTLHSLGVLRHFMGDDDGARESLERAVAVIENALGPDHRFLANALFDLATLLSDVGEPAAALPLFERTRSIYDKTYGREHLRTGMVLTNMALTLSEMGDLRGARSRLEDARGIVERALGPEHPELAEVLSPLALVKLKSGEYAAARADLNRALELVEKNLGPANPRGTGVLRSLAVLDWLTHDDRAALSRSLRVQGILNRHFRQVARSLSEMQALQYQVVVGSAFDVACSALLRLGPGTASSRATRQAWDEWIRSRSMVLDEMARRYRIVREAGDWNLAPQMQAVEAARRNLAELTVRGPDAEHPEKYARAFRDAQETLSAAERRLAERSSAYRRDQAQAQVGLTEVARALGSESALVAFAQYQRLVTRDDYEALEALPTAGAPAPGSRLVLSYVAFVLRSGQRFPAVVPLGAAAEVDSRIQDWAREVRTLPKDLEAAARYHEVGGRLREAIWDPIVPHLSGARRVFVVPDGALHLVNFATLPTDADHYLAETGPTLHYLSAERDLVRHRGSLEAASGLLVLGGPDYDAEPSAVQESDRGEESGSIRAATVPGAERVHRGAAPSCTDFASVRFGSLPGAAAEADEISAVWRQRYGPLAGREGNVIRLSGKTAGEAAFKRSAHGHRVLHLSTHGFFVEDRCASALERPASAGPRAEAPLLKGDNPLLLTGLALAGANLRGQAGGGDTEDGILTAEEIASLDLEGTEWVVLSACDTGAGLIRAGEGVLGLRRAFEIAGASTVVMSLWDVPDQAAREWMRKLYEVRLAGSSTAESVRAASVAMIEARRTAGQTSLPFAWGAFVAAGDWR